MSDQTQTRKSYLKWFGRQNRSALKGAFKPKQKEPTKLKDMFPKPDVLSLSSDKKGLRVTTPPMAMSGAWWKVKQHQMSPQMRRTRNRLKRDKVSYTPLGRAIRPLLKRWREP